MPKKVEKSRSATVQKHLKKDKKDLIIEELTKKEEQKDQIILTTMWVFLTILLAFFLMICYISAGYGASV